MLDLDKRLPVACHGLRVAMWYSKTPSSSDVARQWHIAFRLIAAVLSLEVSLASKHAHDLA